MKKFIWEWEEINECLPIYDAIYAHILSPNLSRMLEIGTWKGGWAISMAENDDSRQIICVDPYPNLDHIREAFLQTAKNRAPNRVVLYRDVNEALINELESFDVIHLDGEHSQSAVEHDLRLTAPLLDLKGLYIIDDIFYHSFPGVTAAAFQYIDQLDLAPFLFSEKKLYLCRKSEYQDYYSKARKMLVVLKLEFEEDQQLTGTNSSYLQRNSINNYSILIPKVYSEPPQEFLSVLSVKRKKSLKSTLLYWSPPVLTSFLKKLLRDWLKF
jgi:hypothetical protein